MEGAEYSETKDIFRTLLIYNSTTSHMAYYVRGCATSSYTVNRAIILFEVFR